MDELMDELDGWWEVVPDPEHPGRFKATARWRDYENQAHEVVNVVNMSTPEDAAAFLLTSVKETAAEHRQFWADADAGPILPVPKK